MRKSLLTLLLFCSASCLADVQSAPDRVRGEGPHERLILHGVTLISGEGAPAIRQMIWRRIGMITRLLALPVKKI